MASSNQKQSRRDQILQALAHMLETSPGQRITTARLAAEVGVSEAALYRHFPSKARMFEGLIDFIEDSLLSRVNLIMAEEKDTMARCHHILQLLLVFAERNPGITRSSRCCARSGCARVRASSSTRPCWPICCWPTPKVASVSLYAPSSSSNRPPDSKISGNLSAVSCCRADRKRFSASMKKGGLGLPSFLCQFFMAEKKYQMRPGLSRCVQQKEGRLWPPFFFVSGFYGRKEVPDATRTVALRC